VTSGGRRRGLLFAAGLLLVAACGADPSPSGGRIDHPTALAGTSWRLVGIGERLLPADPVMSLLFTSSEASGSGGCNAFGGTYAYDPGGGVLRIESLVSTKRACVEPARNGVEAAFFEALRSPLTAAVDDAGRLVLVGRDVTLRFEVGPQQGAPEAPP
jgi:heat shock protein HslJ